MSERQRANHQHSTELAPERIRADVAALLGCTVGEIDPDEDLLDRGVDSIRLMSLVEQWRQAGATGLEFADLAEQPVLRHWERLVGGAA
ncbi:MAG: phosphopantetheine-binding protein [Pseudonocardia sp.]